MTRLTAHLTDGFGGVRPGDVIVEVVSMGRDPREFDDLVGGVVVGVHVDPHFAELTFHKGAWDRKINVTGGTLVVDRPDAA